MALASTKTKSDDWADGYRQGARDALTYIRGVVDGYLLETDTPAPAIIQERIMKASRDWARRDHAPIGHA